MTILSELRNDLHTEELKFLGISERSITPASISLKELRLRLRAELLRLLESDE